MSFFFGENGQIVMVFRWYKLGREIELGCFNVAISHEANNETLSLRLPDGHLEGSSRDQGDAERLFRSGRIGGLNSSWEAVSMTISRCEGN